MAIKLYSVLASPPCRTIILLAEYLGIKLETIETSPLKGDTKKEEFLKINPQHVIPTLVDEDGFTVWESRTIARYLAQKYGGANESLYPTDLKERTEVDKILDFDLGTLYSRLIDYIFPIMSTGKTDGAALPKLSDSLTVVESLLNARNGDFISTDQFTIADLAVFVSVSTLQLLNFDLQNYPLTKKWLSTIKATIPNYEKVGVPLEEALTNMITSCLKDKD